MRNSDTFFASVSGREVLKDLYGGEASSADHAVRRYSDLCSSFRDHFKSEASALVSVPGRVEIGGNHTDHNHGKVIAGSISVDAAALCSKNSDMKVVLYDLAYHEVLTVDLSRLEVDASETGRPEGLIRGVAAGLQQRGFTLGGCNGVLHNEVLSGSGLSSSAVFEVAIGTIFNVLYNNGTIGPLELAKIGQFAENRYFGKPCGLMDQCACALGGLVYIDFADPQEPIVERMENYPAGYGLAVVRTGGSHAGLTDAYAAIPAEMKCAASVCGRRVLRGTSFNELLLKAAVIRKKCGDRAFLRALHFVTENNRVEEQKKALASGNTDVFLTLVQESGSSSWKYLQNISPGNEPFHQGMAAALAVSEIFIRGKGRGAVRVHGGGFAGTILAFIHDDDMPEYRSLMETFTGTGSVSTFSIRNRGAATVQLPA